MKNQYLKLEEEEPLILEQVHEEKISQKKFKNKFLQLQEKWLDEAKILI